MHGDPGILQTVEPQRDADGDGRREEAGIQRRKGEQAAEAEQQGGAENGDPALHAEAAGIHRDLQLQQGIQNNIDAQQHRKCRQNALRQEGQKPCQQGAQDADGKVKLKGEAVEIVGVVADHFGGAGQQK